MGSEFNLKPVINLGNSIVGVSILAIPYCYSQCGVVLGSLLVFFNALLTIWSCKMLIRAANMTRSHTYETLALAVLGKKGKLLIEISIIALNIGTCIAYFVIIGDLAPPIIAKVFGIHVAPSTFRATILVISALFVAFPLGLLRNIDSLSAVSGMSLIFYFSLAVEVIVLSKTNIQSGVWHSKIIWWSSSGLLKCLPILSLAFACHTQMFVIYSSLHDPGVRKMSWITDRAVWMVFLIYSVVGFFGYITFCNKDIKGDILANFSLDLISQLTRLGFATSVVVSFPLMIFPCRASINSLFCSQAPNELHVQEPIPQNRFIYITAGIVGTTVVIAILIPNIETVLALTGATVGSLICFIFPGLLFLKVAGSSADFSNRAKLVLTIGFISMVLSTAVVIHTEATRSSEIESPVGVDAKKPDIVKLPPLAPQGPADKISDKGVNKNIEERVKDLEEGDKEARKEPPLPEQPNKEDSNKVVEKPVGPVKPDNPANDVINIPPNGGDKNKPVEPVLRDIQPQIKQGGEEVKVAAEEKDQGHHLEKKEPAREEQVKQVEEGKPVGEKAEGGGVVAHEILEKHIEKLSDRVDQLEVENRELREKQDVIERIHGLQEDEGREGEKGDVAAAEKIEQHKEEDIKNQENLHQELPNEVVKPAGGNNKVDLDKQEQAILEALERDDREKAKKENQVTAAEEKKDHEVERRAAAPVGGGAADAGDDPHTEFEEEKKKEEGKVNEGEDGKVVGGSKLKIGGVHLVEEEELGDNAGNIAPAKGPEVGIGGNEGENLPPPPDGEKVESYKKRDILNVESANHSIKSR